MAGDYIKLNRQLLEWGWYKDTNTLALWIHLLLKANWKDGEFMGYKVPRGSLATSLPHLAEETGLTIKQIRTALKHLEETEEISRKRAGNFSLITIEKYASFQDVPVDVGSPRAVRGQSKGSPRATIEEGKKVRREEDRDSTLF